MLILQFLKNWFGDHAVWSSWTSESGLNNVEIWDGRSYLFKVTTFKVTSAISNFNTIKTAYSRVDALVLQLQIYPAYAKTIALCKEKNYFHLFTNTVMQ